MAFMFTLQMASIIALYYGTHYGTLQVYNPTFTIPTYDKSVLEFENLNF